MNCLVCSSFDLYQDELQSTFPLTEKLKICIPEIEWDIEDKFCVSCVVEISKFHSFKVSCMKAYFHHQKKPQEPLDDLPVNFQDDHVEDYNFPEHSSSPGYPLSPSNEILNTPAAFHGSSSTQDIESHLKAEPIFNCFVCAEQFSEKDILAAHLQNEHLTSNNKEINKEAVVLSTSPDSRTLVTQEFTQEIDKHKQKPKEGRKPVRKYSCEVCGEYFKFARNVIDHAAQVHNIDEKTVKPYSCEICDMRFSCCANLLQHKKYHDKTRSLICAFCGKSFITKSDLTVHEHTHYNRRNYKCEQCDKAFNTNKTLRSHNLVCHTKPELWKYECAMCARRFPLKSGHDQHLKRHLGDKKHNCHICDKSFVSASELKKHVMFHSNVRAFKCATCGKEYKEKKLYQVHLRKVHNIGSAKVPVRVKKFTCQVCGNLFADRQKLERHMCTHTGIKPYPCDMCIKRFTDKSYLKNHKKVVHGVIELDGNCRITIL